jgi:hypothetical protein
MGGVIKVFIRAVVTGIGVFAIFCLIGWYSSFSAAARHSNGLGGGWFWIISIVGVALAGWCREVFKEMRSNRSKNGRTA